MFKSSIDRPLLAPKAFYFFYFAAMASLSPFLVLYYEQRGLSGSQIGLLAGLPPLIGLFSAPLVGGLADATQKHSLFLRGGIVSLALAILALSLAGSFVVFIFCIIFYAFSIASILPLVDNTVLDLLGDRKNQYGKQRLWGSVGWGLAAPVAGLLVDDSGLQWAFYVCFSILLVLLAVSFRLQVSRGHLSRTFWSGLRLLLTNQQWFLFLSVIFTGGASLAIIHSYLFLYLNALGAGAVTMGLALTVSTISEFLVMFYADRLLARFGTRGLLILALAIFVIRLFGYAYTSLPWVILLLQLLQGPTFAGMWLAGVARADELAPPGMGATAQGLLSGVMMGLGSAFGAITGGIIYQNWGIPVLFQLNGLAVLLCLVVYGAASWRLIRLKLIPTKS
jgi:MFS transporter, PPP family, 3-phenylpropionic acid transporter